MSEIKVQEKRTQKRIRFIPILIAFTVCSLMLIAPANFLAVRAISDNGYSIYKSTNDTGIFRYDVLPTETQASKGGAVYEHQNATGVAKYDQCSLINATITRDYFQVWTNSTDPTNSTPRVGSLSLTLDLNPSAFFDYEVRYMRLSIEPSKNVQVFIGSPTIWTYTNTIATRYQIGFVDNGPGTINFGNASTLRLAERGSWDPTKGYLTVTGEVNVFKLNLTTGIFSSYDLNFWTADFVSARTNLNNTGRIALHIPISGTGDTVSTSILHGDNFKIKITFFGVYQPGYSAITQNLLQFLLVFLTFGFLTVTIATFIHGVDERKVDVKTIVLFAAMIVLGTAILVSLFYII